MGCRSVRPARRELLPQCGRPVDSVPLAVDEESSSVFGDGRRRARTTDASPERVGERIEHIVERDNARRAPRREDRVKISPNLACTHHRGGFVMAGARVCQAVHLPEAHSRARSRALQARGSPGYFRRDGLQTALRSGLRLAEIVRGPIRAPEVRMSPEHTPTSFLVLHSPEREGFVQGVPALGAVAIGVAPALATAGIMLDGGGLALAVAGVLATLGVVASILTLDP
jgi:hypothetical protein